MKPGCAGSGATAKFGGVGESRIRQDRRDKRAQRWIAFVQRAETTRPERHHMLDRLACRHDQCRRVRSIANSSAGWPSGQGRLRSVASNSSQVASCLLLCIDRPPAGSELRRRWSTRDTFSSPEPARHLPRERGTDPRRHRKVEYDGPVRNAFDHGGINPMRHLHLGRNRP